MEKFNKNFGFFWIPAESSEEKFFPSKYSVLQGCFFLRISGPKRMSFFSEKKDQP